MKISPIARYLPLQIFPVLAGLALLCVTACDSKDDPSQGSAATEVNLIPNPSFATVSPTNPSLPAYWSTATWGTNTTAFSYPTSGRTAGSHSVEISVTGFTSGDAKWVHEQVPVTPTAKYIYHDWYKSSVATKLTAAFTLTDGSTSYATFADSPASSSWRNEAGTLTVPADARGLTVYHLIAAVGVLQLDDVSLALAPGQQISLGSAAAAPDAEGSGQVLHARPDSGADSPSSQAVGADPVDATDATGVIDATLSSDRPELPHLVETDEQVLFTSFAGWTVHTTGGASVALTGGDGYESAASAAVLTTDGAGGDVYIESPVLSAVDLTRARLRMALKVTDRSLLGSGAPWIEVTIGDASLASYYQFYWDDAWASDIQPIVADGEWSESSWPWPARTAVGTPDRSAIAKIRFRIYDNGGGQSTSVELGKVSTVADMADLYPTGLITVWFDDGYESVYTQAFPVLSALGLRASFAVITDAIGTTDYVTLAELQKLAAAGWDIVEHSPTGAMHASGLTAVDSSVLLPALVADRAWFASQGFSNKYLAYPSGNWSIGGATNARAVAIAAGFTGARTIWSDNPDVFPPSDPFTLRTKTVSGITTTNDQIATLTQWVTTGPAMLGFLYHQVITGIPTTDDQIDVDTFEQQMTILRNSGAQILTISEVLP